MFSFLRQRTSVLLKFFKAHKKQVAVFGILSFLFLSAYLVAGVQGVRAGDDATSVLPTGNFEPGVFVKAIINILLYVAQVMLKFAVFALAFIIQVAGYNGYLNSTAVNIGWVMVRDITNMFFVVVLLLVAFGTILGLEQYEWKKMLVKFFFAAVLVNFSRIICGVVIDLGQVIMITFVNGIAATAGGNLINAFGLTDIFSLSDKVKDPGQLTNSGEVFGSAVAAVVFSALTLAIMVAFLWILLARLIVLWILIVLSPFAFVLSVIPQTEKYASQWWSEFGNHVVVGPAVVFFLWLSFAVVGGGNINQEIADNSQVPQAQKDFSNGPASPSAAMDWNHMANFAIGIGILLVGAKTSQSLGTVGGSAMSQATDFAKKTAMIASGAAAGLWAGRKAWEGTKAVGAGLGKAAYFMTAQSLVERTKMKLQRNVVEGYKSLRVGLAGLRPEMEDELDANGNKTGKRVPVYEMKDVEEDELDANGNPTGNKVTVQKRVPKMQKVGGEGMVGNVLRFAIGGGYRAELMEKKKLEKVQRQTETREELFMKRAGAVPQHIFQRLEGEPVRDLERLEAGMLEAEEERSSAKTTQFKAQGREMILSNSRFKAGNWENGPGTQTMAQQIAGHKERTETYESQIKNLFSTAKNEFLRGKAGKDILKARIAADFSAEVMDSASHLEEGTAKLHYLESDAEGMAALAELTKVQALEKEEHAKMEKVEKAEERKFYETGPGAHALAEQKAAELAAAVSGEYIKKAETAAELTAKTAPTGAALLQEQKEVEVATGAAAALVKEVETEAERKAKLAQMAELQKTKEAEVRTGALEAEVKTTEAGAETAAKIAQRAALQRQKEEEVKAGAVTATGKTVETEAEAAAKRAQRTALQKTKEEEVKTGAAAALTKEAETVAEREAKIKEAAALEAQKATEVRTGLAAAQVKTKETAAEAAAKEKEKAALQATKEEEVITGVSAAAIKEKETIAEREAKIRQKAALEAQKAAEVRTGATAAEVKAEEAKAEAVAKEGEKGAGGALERQKAAELKAKVSAGRGTELEAEAERVVGDQNKDLYKTLSLSEMAAEASKNFLEIIKQEQIAAIFKGSEAQLKAALEKLKGGMKFDSVVSGLTDPAARAKLAEVQSRYYKDRVVGATRERSEDAAESLWSVERTGNETPPTAFKNGVRKAMEPLAEVEREKSVDMATRSVLKMMRKRKNKEPLDPDQEAVFMASTKHLVKNAWSDDQLHRFAQVVRNFMGNKYKAGTDEYEEAKGLKELLVDQLGWGSIETDAATGQQTLNMASISSEKRTNDLQHLMGFSGDASMMLSENAVLLNQRTANGSLPEDQQLGYSDAAAHLSDSIRTGIADGMRTGLSFDDSMKAAVNKLAAESEEAGRAIGWTTDRIKAQIQTFADNFVAPNFATGDKDKDKEAYVSRVKEHSSAQEMLTEMKAAAVATTHIDDAGHNIHDVEEGYAHGQLSDDSMRFMLSDWVKVQAANKMGNLKSHAIGEMDEDFGTLSNWDPERFGATFSGVVSRLLVERLDERVRRHILKNAAGEALKKDKDTGAVIVGDEDSVLVKKKFGGDMAKAEVDIARDWSVALSKNADAFLLLAGMNSGVDEASAKAGELNIKVFGEHVTDIAQLVDLVNKKARWNDTNVAGFERDTRKVGEMIIDQATGKPTGKVEKLTVAGILPKYVTPADRKSMRKTTPVAQPPPSEEIAT